MRHTKLEDYPQAASALAEFYKKKNVQYVIDAAPGRKEAKDGKEREKGEIHTIIDIIDPTFVFQAFIAEINMEKVIVPDSIKPHLTDQEAEVIESSNVDSNESQLYLLHAAGYSRWPEVKTALDQSEIDTSSFSNTKTHLLKDVGVI